MSSLLSQQFFHIFPQQIYQDQDDSLTAINNLKLMLEDWDFQNDRKNLLAAVTTEIYSKKFSNLHYLARLTFETSPSTLNITFFILQNNIPFKILSRNHKIKLYGLLMRMNANIFLGKFSICPKSGLLRFSSEILIFQNCMEKLKNPKLKTQDIHIQLLQKIENNIQIIQTCLVKIIKLTNLTSIVTENPYLSKRKKIQPYSNSYQKQICQISNIIPYIHEDYNYLIKSAFHISQNQPNKNISSILRIISIFQKNIATKSKKSPIISSEKLAELTLLDRVNDLKTINLQKLYRAQILLERQSIKKIKNISSTLNCSVALFSGKKFNSNQYRKKQIIEFVKKSPSNPKGEKSILRQIQFIDLLIVNGSKQVAAQYFKINTFQGYYQPENRKIPLEIQHFSQNFLYMKFHPCNINEYISRRKLFMSINSKLLLLLKIDKSLSSLHSKMCQHMDLKPQNIMLDYNENIKLIDFGQSVHPNLPLSSKPGVSIPYSPPQFFSKYKFTPDRCDNYSFGVMIFQILFECLPQSLPSRKQKALMFYQDLSSYINLFQCQPERLENSFEKLLSQLIARLCMKCLHQNSSQRPLESWIRIYLRKLIEFSLKY